MSRYTRSEASDENSENEQRRVQLMAQLAETEKCRDIIRMRPHAFLQLCEKLRSYGHVKDLTRATVEGQVAEFLYIVGHDPNTRTMPALFHQSSWETFYERFNNVSGGIILLHEELVRQPSSDVDVPLNLLNDNKFYPYFKVMAFKFSCSLTMIEFSY